MLPVEGAVLVSIQGTMFATFNGFWENVFRYPRYFISTLLGVFFVLFAWLKPLFKNPVTAIALIGFFFAGLTFIALTLRAMLGLSPV